jgi:hypothetical protein
MSWLSAKYTPAPDGTGSAGLVTEGAADAGAADSEATAAAVVAGGTLEPAELELAHPAASTVTAIVVASAKRRVTRSSIP